MSTTYGISWIYEEFQAVRLSHGKCVERWSATYPVNDLSDFNRAVSSASAKLNMRRGGDIAIAYESDEHLHVFLDIPPMSTRDIEKYLERRVNQEKKFEGTAAWGYRIIRHNDKGEGVLLHIMPRNKLDAIMRICEQSHVIPRRLVPLTDVMAQHYLQLNLPNEQFTLLIALFDSRVEMVVVSGSGEVLFVRELGFHWKFDDMERLRTDMQRTLLYAKQRHASVVTHVSIMGVDAADAENHLQPHFEIPVTSDTDAIDAIFWASEVSTIPRRTTSNLIPPTMRRTITSRQIVRTTTWMAITATIAAIVVVVQVEFLVARYGKKSQQTIALTIELEEEKALWTGRRIHLSEAKKRLEVLTHKAPPLPAWLLANLGDIVPEDMILNKAEVMRKDRRWVFNLHGATIPSLNDTASTIEELEHRLSESPWNAHVSRSWEEKWLKQLSNGKAGETGLIAFHMNGELK